MKTLNIFISFIDYKRYKMTSFFYVVSSACNTSVPAFRKCMDASLRKFFCLRAQPLMHRLLDLSSDLKDLPSIACLSGPNTRKSLRARSGEYGGCERHSKDRSWIVATVERAEHCHVATKHLYSNVHVV